MNWTCPHCQRKLAATEPPPSGTAPEGWFYTLCGQCQGRSIVRAATGEALRIRKVEPRIDALPVAIPIEIPPPPADLIARAPRKRWRPLPRVAAFSVPLIFFTVGTGAYLLDQRRESLARAIIARDIAAQLIAKETPSLTSDSGTFTPSDPKSEARKVRSTDIAIHHRTPLPGATDRLQSSAASTIPARADPAHESNESNESNEAFEVQARDRTASLHSGPGSEYAILGVANPEDRYAVLEMTPHWFKIPLGEAGQVAWIQRRDVDVRVEKEPAAAISENKEADHD